MSLKRMLILLVAVLALTCSGMAIEAGNYQQQKDEPNVNEAVLSIRPDMPLVGSANPNALKEIAIEEAKKDVLKEKEEIRKELRKEAEKKLEEKRIKEEKLKKEAEEKAKQEQAAKEKTEVENEKESSEFEWDGEVLNSRNGIVQGPSGKESYYNLDMNGVIKEMRRLGYSEKKYPYSVREDGVKMLGNYVMCAANLKIRPKGTIIQTTLGKAIVCDTGSFAKKNPTQLDIAVAW